MVCECVGHLSAGGGRGRRHARNTSIQQRSGLEFQPFGRNPNDFVNAVGRLSGDVGWQYKLQGVVSLPWRFQASASLDSHANAHRMRTRTIPASVAGQSSTIILQPRGDLGRLPWITILDARIQKDFALGGGSRLTLFLDALNLNNENSPQAVVSANVTNELVPVPHDVRRAAPLDAQREVQLLRSLPTGATCQPH